MPALPNAEKTAPKTAKGVQAGDVWAAADAVLATGEKPTIERVRQQMGRGSPNTVGPLLDTWFAGLAQRLEESVADGLPAEVQRAAMLVWKRAQRISQAAAQAQLQAERDTLAEQRQAVAAEQDAIQQERMRWEDRFAALRQTLELAQAQSAQTREEKDRLLAQLAQKDTELAGQREQLAALQHTLTEERSRHQQQLDAWQVEKKASDERWQATDRRWMLELDGARTELKRGKALLAQAAQKVEQLEVQIDSNAQHHLSELTQAQTEGQAMRHELSARTAKIEQLLTQLAEKKAAPAPQRPSMPPMRTPSVRPLRSLRRR